MSVGVMKDYKLKQRNLRASHTLGWLFGRCACLELGGAHASRIKINVCFSFFLSPKTKLPFQPRPSLKLQCQCQALL
jgi:hypothetical protein